MEEVQIQLIFLTRVAQSKHNVEFVSYIIFTIFLKKAQNIKFQNYTSAAVAKWGINGGRLPRPVVGCQESTSFCNGGFFYPLLQTIVGSFIQIFYIFNTFRLFIDNYTYQKKYHTSTNINKQTGVSSTTKLVCTKQKNSFQPMLLPVLLSFRHGDGVQRWREVTAKASKGQQHRHQ